MPNRLYRDLKLDVGLVSQVLNNSNATGRYFDVSKYREITVVLIAAAMASGTTSKVELLQAKDAAGTGSKAIVGTDAIITANSKVTVAQVVFGSAPAPANGDTVTINGVVFTKAAATSVALRQFLDSAGLVSCVNDAAFGVTGVTASDNAGTVTFVSKDPGETVVTVAATGAGFTVSTVQSIAYVNITASELDIAGDFGFIAPRVTTTANTVVSVILLRGVPRYMPDQKVAAGTIL